jgi:hypothetical protein
MQKLDILMKYKLQRLQNEKIVLILTQIANSI